MDTDKGASDHVDQVLADWARERPDWDMSAAAVIARLGRASAYIERGLHDTFEEFGLNRVEFDVLATLTRSGPPKRLPPGQLVRALMRSSGAITHIVDRLEAGGLVERTLDEDDRRSILVGLTKKGSALFERVAAAHLENERTLLEALTPEEQQTLAWTLKKLLLGFEAESAQPVMPRSGRKRHRFHRRKVL
ncbi:MAG: MarR family transcriptional regulator [Gaiellaceae bacterium MAG52_C11]|nr:MarR family transcriptional regulator [Candidatus Gaiellasilicea maunaloa]